MNTIAHFVPKAELSAQQNIGEFIRHCRDELAIYNWEDLVWKHTRTGKRAAAFTRHGVANPSYPKDEDAFLEPFLSQVKAYVRYNQTIRETTSIGNFPMYAFKILHDALLDERLGGIPDILNVDGVVQQKASKALMSRYDNPDVRYKVGGALVSIYSFIRDKGFVPGLPEWKSPHRKPLAKAIRTDSESVKWQEKRLPTLHEITSLADCFAQAEAEEDVFWSSVIVMLMFAPSRAGELSSLTTDCLIERDGNLYVRWHGKKGYGAYSKVVPKLLEPSVREAVRRLINIGEPARKAARFAYDNPGEFFHHEGCLTSKDYPRSQRLSSHQVSAAMGIAMSDKCKVDSPTAWRKVGPWVNKCLDANGHVTYKTLAQEVQRRYFGERFSKGEMEQPKAGDSDKPLWDSLIIHCDKQFNKQKSVSHFSWATLDVNRLNDQLRGRVTNTAKVPSIFERMGKVNDDGENIKLTSHQIRVWLSTVAERAGMDDWTIAHWAARVDIKQNAHYDLRTKEEIREPSKTVMVPEFSSDPAVALANLKKRPSAIELVRMNQPVAFIDLGKLMVGAAQSTLYGFCTTDWAQSPCLKAHQCLTCKEHKCVKGDEKKLENLKQHRDFLKLQFERAKKAVESEVHGADIWEEKHRQDFQEVSKKIQELAVGLTTAETVVRILEDESVPDGAIVSIPPEHDPDPVERVLISRGVDREPRDQDIIGSDSILSLIGISNV
ncbi:hypothetical protein LY622_22155 [Halomonas sp. M5N1S17]|uniref:hypothetical protein n=1 Tax=Halomonas alkalisoli TaxID=2907158 RepID=UPI001F2BA951|nr:hypothetical protein [Halomonas alkalisoli]MCE9666136.1 hypothetical protein [Halomonas alkalisoli]